MATPHIILFEDVNCIGNHMHVCEGYKYPGSAFNDKTTSFVILEGNWEFFVRLRFRESNGWGG